MALDDCVLAPKLDPVRERFVQEYRATGNASEAYRRANPKSAEWTPHTLHVKASKVLAEDEVCMRLEELQVQAAQRHETTIDSLTTELEAAREMAMNNGQPSAAVSATMGKAKLHGFLVDQVRADIKDHRDPHELSDAELMARIKELEDSLAFDAGKEPTLKARLLGLACAHRLRPFGSMVRAGAIFTLVAASTAGPVR